MEEIENWHKGKVDEWKVMRVHAYIIALSSGNLGKSPPRIDEMMPLPYDEDEQQPEDDDRITTFYNNATK